MSWFCDLFPKFEAAVGDYKLKEGKRGKGRCPNRNRHKSKDRNHSLAFRLGELGGLTFACMAGCRKVEILAAAGCTWRDVCRNKPEFSRNPQTPRAPMKRFVCAYAYRRPVTDADPGSVEYESCRYFPKDFRGRRPMPGVTGEYAYRLSDGWVQRVESHDRIADPTGFRWVECREDANGARFLPAVRPTLYNSDMISALAPDMKFLFWCEGEKDADALAKLGLVATTVAQGSANRMWCPEWSGLVRGRTVIFLPDNDTPGVEYAAWYAGCCLVARAAAVATVRLPGLKKKGDVSDWLFVNRASESDTGPSSPLVRKFKSVIAQADLYRPQKLYVVYGGTPPKDAARPQALSAPERAAPESLPACAGDF